MSIAFIHEIYPFGGAEKVTTILAEYFIKKGYNVSIFAREFLKDQLESSITYFQLPDIKNNDAKSNAEFIVRTINENHIDIFIVPILHLKHIEYIKANVKCKLIFTHHSVPMWEAINKYSLAEKRGKTSLIKKLEWLFFQKPKYKIFRRHYKRILKSYRTTYNIFDSYVTLIEPYKNKIIELLKLNPKDNKVISISNPLSSSNIHEVRTKKKQVIYVGRMSYADKRVDRLINIWSKLCEDFQDWDLILVGDGPEKTNLENLAEQLGIRNIKFVGFQKDVTPYYLDASILCLTSTFEGWGLVLTEAQTYGVIPIAYNCSEGITEILGPSGTNGFLIDCFDEELYVATLSKILIDEKLRQQLQAKILIKAKSYNIEEVGEEWEKLFAKLLGK